MLGQEQVVVRDEDHPFAHLGATNELDPRPDQLLPEAIGRMRLSRDDELDRAVRVRQDPEQPGRIVEQLVGTLVGGEPPRESEREHGGVQAHADRRCLVRW